MATSGSSANTNSSNPNQSHDVTPSPTNRVNPHLFYAYAYDVYKATPPPTSCVTSLSFSPTADLLVATSWDHQVRCLEVLRTENAITSQPKAEMMHNELVLCCAWKDDGTTVFSGGCDNQAKMWPLVSDAEPITVVTHGAPVKAIAWSPEYKILVTGSWDKTLKYWDPREAEPVHTQQLPDHCCAFTLKEDLMVVGAGTTQLVVFDLRNYQREVMRTDSCLEYQTTCLAAMPYENGFLVGSAGGRCAAHHLHNGLENQNYYFDCQLGGAVTSLNFNPKYGTYASTGTDGTFNFWDKDSIMWIKGSLLRFPQPITCSSFNRDGSIFAYALGVDVHKPHAAKNSILFHVLEDDELRRRIRPPTLPKP